MDPGKVSRKQTYSSITTLTKERLQELKRLKQKLGFTSYDALLNYLVKVIDREGAIPVANPSLIFCDTRPAIITGESGSGKTTTVKTLLRSWEGNVFVVDTSNEYTDLKEVDLGQFFALDWERGGRYRFVPDANVDISKVEAGTIFSRLVFLMHQGGLREWMVIVEEGHRFSSDANLRALLIEARKFIRKLIIITTDWRIYEGIAPVYHPLPLSRE